MSRIDMSRIVMSRIVMCNGMVVVITEHDGRRPGLPMHQ